MVSSRTYHALHLDIASFPSERICYVILPEKLKESEHPWIESMAATHGANFVVISGVNWEEDLTPWKAPGLKSGEFAGKEVTFEYNEGNHFGPLIERIEKAINGIY